MEYKYIRCKRCNRLLRTDEARLRGYGTYCWILYKKGLIKNRRINLFNVDVKP